MNISDRLEEFKSTWGDLYRRTEDDFINFICLTSYHSAKVLSDLSNILTPPIPQSGKKLIVFSTSEKRRLVQTKETEIAAILEESENESANLVGLTDRISQIYKTTYGELFLDEFYRALAFLELLSHLAKIGAETRLKNIDREVVSELNYSIYQLEKTYLDSLVTFRRNRGRRAPGRKSAGALRKLIMETW